MTVFARCVEALDVFEPRCVSGTVDAVRGMTVLVRRLRVPIGSVVRIEGAARHRDSVLGEVIGFSDSNAIVMLLAGSNGTGPGDRVHLERVSDSIMVGDSWLGRVIDGLGRPIDGGPPPEGLQARPLFPPVVNPMTRGIVREPLATGVRAIDGLTTIGKGQRIELLVTPEVQHRIDGALAGALYLPTSIPTSPARSPRCASSDGANSAGTEAMRAVRRRPFG